MSSLQTCPTEVTCGGDREELAQVAVVAPREVPLGGPRAMTVRRTLPARGRTMIGAWCFVDHYGPDDIAQTGGMVVPVHPHTALQTVSWLFSGEVEHRDSTGVHAIVRPGELNLMTAGRGVCHSEMSVTGPGAPSVLHGAQLWVALPAEYADVAAGFEHHAPEPLVVEGACLRVFLGSLGPVGGSVATSPVTTFTPLLGAEVVLEPGARIELSVEETFEHGVLCDEGHLSVLGAPVARSQLAYLGPGRTCLTLAAGADGARVLVLGGPPFGEQIVMWWNFIGRSHEDVVAAREQWQVELGHDPDGRFGAVDDADGASLRAPELPHVRLRPRD